ncbi:MAG: penicillin-binding protein 1B, partial [Methylococcaceae bacterium]|nr:penicillin-binding protein 1B [Methylococcaceae bacterium]
MAERIKRTDSGKRISGRYGRTIPPKKTTTRFRWFKGAVLVVFVGFALVLASYLGYLDYNIRKQFEGKRWSIPARVYASPVELYAGYNLPIDQFEELLQGLHYREEQQLSSEGTYYRQGRQITLKTRDFDFWDQQQASTKVQLSFNESGIENLIDASSSKNLAIVRMDPEQIGTLYPSIKEDRILIKLEEAPDALIKGLLASEDRDFYNHFGISLKGIVRAMWANVQAGGLVQGGSTLTQQLARNFYLSSEKSFTRKLNEVFMSLILEYRYSKDEILGAYLNEVYLGQDGASAVHGFGLASEFYFGSSLKDLPLEHVASLVSLVRGPSYYDPRRYPDRALQRRNLVLEEMEAEGYITAKQAAEAKAKPLAVIANTHRSSNRYPGFLDLVKRQLRQEYREEDLTTEGLKIFTTLDTRAQNILEKTVHKKLDQLEKLPKTEKLQTAVVVTRRDSGEIVALMSGRDGSDTGFNRAIDAVRPIGSLIKPVVYLTALEYPNKYTITTPISDASVFVKGTNGNDWRPENYDHQEHGVIGLHTALAQSYNHATVRVGMDIGVARTAKTLKNLGVNRSVDLFPSFLLGAAQLTPMEVTQMYQTLAGDGFLTPLKAIRAVVASDNMRLQSYPFTVRQVVDPAATYITNTILQEVMHQGTGRSAYSTFPGDYGLVGKTGTTNDAKDSWFAGYTGDFLAVVWVGRDDNKPAGLTGATGALQVWIPLMRQISTQPVTLTPPDNIKTAWVDPSNGLLANAECEGAKQYPY